MALDQHQRIAQMTMASVYPLYRNKVERKGRTQDELDQVISWLTGLDKKKWQRKMEALETFSVFFEGIVLPAESILIKGNICGYRIEEIENPLTQKVRMLDKLVDELAKGKSLDNIIRKFTSPEKRNTPSKSYTCSKGHVFQKSSDCRTCPQCAQMSKKSYFLPTLSAPAQRALQLKGIHELQQLTEWSAKEILQWHGVGPSAIPKIKDALLAAGLSLKTTP